MCMYVCVCVCVSVHVIWSFMIIVHIYACIRNLYMHVAKDLAYTVLSVK